MEKLSTYDNPHIEQKNYSVVRRNTGYLRLDKQEHADIVRSLYLDLNLYNNFFLPVMILKEIKMNLKSAFENLNLFELKNQINTWQNEFVKLAAPIRNPIEKVKVRRKKGIVHTIPKWRREVNSDTKNPFLERQRMEEMRRAAEQVWEKRK